MGFVEMLYFLFDMFFTNYLRQFNVLFCGSISCY